MRLDAKNAADILKTFIQEDRTEARIWRDRVQSVTCSLVVASFAISAFLIGHIAEIGVHRFQNITLLIDLALVVVIMVFFWRLKLDLVALRKAMKGRQDSLRGLREGEQKEIDPFLKGDKADISDNDLYWVVGLCVAIVLTKMIVLVANAGDLIATGAGSS